jgi:hypothetical protein
MTAKQVDEILREIYDFLLNKGIIGKAEWTNVVEPRIKAAAKKIASSN